MNYKVFVVEDNQEIVQLLRKALSGWGMDSNSCKDFNCVEQEIKEYSPHLVLMDINLPYYNGFPKLKNDFEYEKKKNLSKFLKRIRIKPYNKQSQI